MKTGRRKSFPQDHRNFRPTFHEKSRGSSVVEDRPAVEDRVTGEQDQNK